MGCKGQVAKIRDPLQLWSFFGLVVERKTMVKQLPAFHHLWGIGSTCRKPAALTCKATPTSVAREWERSNAQQNAQRHQKASEVH